MQLTPDFPLRRGDIVLVLAQVEYDHEPGANEDETSSVMLTVDGFRSLMTNRANVVQAVRFSIASGDAVSVNGVRAVVTHVLDDEFAVVRVDGEHKPRVERVASLCPIRIAKGNGHE